MTEGADIILRSAIKFLCSDTEPICRLCLHSISSGINGVYISDTMSQPTSSRYIQEPLTILDMLTELGVTTEQSLPQLICSNCATITYNAYLFQKLCQHSSVMWREVLETIDKGLQQTTQVNPSTKSLFLLMNNDNTLMLETKTATTSNSTKEALSRVKTLVKSRTYYKQNRKQSEHECFTPTINSDTSRFVCPKCGKEFKSAKAVAGHYDRLHRARTIRCTRCDKMFSTKALLSTHVHLNHKPARCHQCNIAFPSKVALKVHQDTHEEHVCGVCNKRYLNRTSYKMHFKYCGSTDTLGFYCDICGKGYVRKNGVRSHLKTEHGFGRALPCRWCRKLFDAPSRRAVHEVKHTKVREFSCEVCGGAFVTRAALLHHSRLHSGVRPYACAECGARFVSASRRAEHARRAHRPPAERCAVCGGQFYVASQLRRHMQRHGNPQSRLYVPVSRA